MLEDLFGKKITKVAPRYKSFYENRIKKLSKEEYDAAVDYICQLIETKTDNGFFQPGWNAGSDWSGTPLQALYEKGCDCNAEEASYLYGLLVKEVFINHIEEDWIVIKQEMPGRDFEQNNYMKKSKKK